MAANRGLTSEAFTILLYSHGNIVFYQRFSVSKLNLGVVCEVKAGIWDDIDHSGEAGQYGCEKLLGDSNISSVPPTAEMTGILAEKNYNLWVKKTPYDLVPNYIASFTLGTKK